MFATSTCVWSWGSPARLERWRKAAARNPLPVTLSAPPAPRRATAALALDVVERGVDGGLVRAADLRAYVVVRETEDDADRLRRREGQVEAWDASSAATAGERVAGARM